MRSLLAVLFIFSFVFALAAEGYLYKWKDADGNIKYGDRPPKGVEYQRIKVRQADSRSASTAITQTEKAAPKPNNEDVKSQLEQAKKQISEACAIAKSNLQTLETARRIKITTPEGETRTMNEDERATKKKETEEKIQRYCIEEGGDGN